MGVLLSIAPPPPPPRFVICGLTLRCATSSRRALLETALEIHIRLFAFFFFGGGGEGDIGPQVLYFLFLKGTMSRDFLFLFFYESVSPQPQSLPLGPFRSFFENLRRYSQVEVHHRYQRHRWQICDRCQRHGRQILPPISLLLLIPVANLPPVSLTPVANNGPNYQTAHNLK